mgnify:CR=1 FL=1
MLGHLLAAEQIETVILERLPEPVTEPRAIAIDAESLRTLQHAGVLQGFRDEVLPGITAEYVNAAGVRLFTLGEEDRQPFGHPQLNSFDQPALDAYLAATLEAKHCVSLFFGHTLEHFEESGDGVSVLATDADGEAVEIRADYLVGCDGGRSTIRRQLGIEMKGDSNPLPWLVIDTVDHHLDDAMDCRFFCDTARPGMTLRKRHGERRWEWMLMPGESPEELLEDAAIRDLLAPHTDAERVNIYRKRVYNFHAIVAERWQSGRVLLAGDAAHMTPPFAGQGLNSGLRDVRNLAWKLAGAVRGDYSGTLLASYEEERSGHARELIDTALALGAQIQPIDPALAAERDAFFTALNSDPAAMADFRSGLMRPIMERSLDRGLVLSSEEHALNGRLLIQPRVNTARDRDVLLDECLGPGFSLIGFGCDPLEVVAPQDLTWWRDRGMTCVAVGQRGQSAREDWLEDAYGDLGCWLEAGEAQLLLVRPDRFCFAVFKPSGASDVLRAARSRLQA